MNRQETIFCMCVCVCVVIIRIGLTDTDNVSEINTLVHDMMVSSLY